MHSKGERSANAVESPGMPLQNLSIISQGQGNAEYLELLTHCLQ